MPPTPMELCEQLRRLSDVLHRLTAECVAAHWPLTADQRMVLDDARAVLAGNPFAPHEPPLTAD
jgi:hypothetical protein